MHIYFLEQSLLVHQRLKYSGANTLVHTHPILTFSHSLSQNKPKRDPKSVMRQLIKCD